MTVPDRAAHDRPRAILTSQHALPDSNCFGQCAGRWTLGRLGTSGSCNDHAAARNSPKVARCRTTEPVSLGGVAGKASPRDDEPASSPPRIKLVERGAVQARVRPPITPVEPDKLAEHRIVQPRGLQVGLEARIPMNPVDLLAEERADLLLGPGIVAHGTRRAAAEAGGGSESAGLIGTATWQHFAGGSPSGFSRIQIAWCAAPGRIPASLRDPPCSS
jgi:hypothetical protein